MLAQKEPHQGIVVEFPVKGPEPQRPLLLRQYRLAFALSCGFSLNKRVSPDRGREAQNPLNRLPLADFTASYAKALILCVWRRDNAAWKGWGPDLGDAD